MIKKSKALKKVDDEITEFLSNDHNRLSISDEEFQMPEVLEKLSSFGANLLRTSNLSLLEEFLERFIDENSKESPCPFMYDALKETFAELSFENAIKANISMSSSASYSDTCANYLGAFSLNKDADIIKNYFNERETKAFTMTPGEGFYANEQDTNTYDTVGQKGSPLYDAKATHYAGDIKSETSYGVRLNIKYEESSYSNTIYYFRDHYIDFKPEEGDLWVGDYIFRFDFDGNLLKVANVADKS